MMGFPDDSFELLKTLVDQPDNASFRHDARTGHIGKTAQLCVSYMDHIWLVLQLTKAVKKLLKLTTSFFMPGVFS